MLELLTNYLTIVVILGVGNKVFPNNIIYNKPLDVFISVILIMFISFIIDLLFVKTGDKYLNGDGKMWSLTVFLMWLSNMSTIVALAIASKTINGFEINGFITYVVLFIIIEVLWISPSKRKEV